MTTDIVTRLRAVAETGCDPDLPHEAAAEIERLDDKLARLTALLEPLRPLEARATPGPTPSSFLYWAFRHASKHDVDWFRTSDGKEMDDDEACRCPRKEDAELFAAARNALAEMLRVVGS